MYFPPYPPPPNFLPYAMPPQFDPFLGSSQEDMLPPNDIFEEEMIKYSDLGGDLSHITDQFGK